MNIKLKFPDFAGNKILDIIIILIALFIAINIFKFQVKNIELLKEKKKDEIKKNEVLDNISQLEKTINSYKNTLDKNKKDISSVLNTISNFAKESAVKIISIKPNKEEDYPQYIKYSFDLAINVNSYHNIGQFLSKLESHSEIYLIDKLNTKMIEKPKESGQFRQESEITYGLVVNLTLSVIAFKF